MQKAALKRLSEIYSKKSHFEEMHLTEQWNFINDMDAIHYMDNSFFYKDYTEKNFNPFNNPYEAFMNYMNVLDDFENHINGINTKLLSSNPHEYNWVTLMLAFFEAETTRSRSALVFKLSSILIMNRESFFHNRQISKITNKTMYLIFVMLVR